MGKGAGSSMLIPSIIIYKPLLFFGGKPSNLSFFINQAMGKKNGPLLHQPPGTLDGEPQVHIFKNGFIP